MVVVKDGVATRADGAEPEEEAEPERFSSLEKKIRALEKLKKSITDLKARMKRGFELDPQQQARCLRAAQRCLARPSCPSSAGVVVGSHLWRRSVAPWLTHGGSLRRRSCGH